MARLDALARFSDEEGHLARTFLSPAHRCAADRVKAWMEEAGMTARIDAIGNVVGRYEGRRPGAPALLIGSHLDTVRRAGRYDGSFGVLTAVAAVAELSARGMRFETAVEVIAFGDEEGVRFPTTLSGSRAIAGTFDAAALDLVDDRGITLRDALAAFGCDPAAIGAVARRPEDILGYVEVHIEQGPVLEREGLAVGVVTAIAGASRAAIDVAGEAGHAGTVPMGLRRDALAAAAEMVLAVESTGRSAPDLVATVGRLVAEPGAVNVIPGRAAFTVDLRHPEDAVREAAIAALEGRIREIATRRGVRAEIRPTHAARATRCDPGMIAALSRAVAEAGLPVRLLPSGAGHDAMAVAALCPVGMLFVRCAGGVSHDPAEAVDQADAGAALDVLLRFLLNVLHAGAVR
ncbi:allantoate amidohydrolase [Rhizobiales bacterium L72]|uniref:Allantoate amidohydrolase n=2 Tax=Propylenella binzhouense TaxID=2555902 RepID=A0A964T1B6_9HYPH|nr:allantoate amidohydrolase [Propylenella binzhouense]MYZ46500.1 allantoate amidohydrolase [Propylenella binzhouense]